MKPLLATLALLLVWGCDSGSDAPQLGGRYDGSQTVVFASASQTFDIDFDIRLDIDAPGASGAFTGDVVFDRGAIGNVDATTARGTVSGTISGTTVSLAARASQFSSRTARRGDGLALNATGTLREDGTLVLSQSTLVDFAYGTSDTFSLTLAK